MKYVKLGEICEFINGDRGKNYPSDKDFVDKGIPFINAGHIQHNDINFDNMNYISREKFNVLGSGKVRKNDILYCLRGSLGKNALVNIEEGAIASSLVILRPKYDFIDMNYLINYLNSNFINEQILKANNGSSQPNLSAASVKNFSIFLPSYEEQKEISKILGKSKDLIDKRKEQINALDELVKSQFIEMFGDPVINPYNWNKEELGIICDVRDGTHDSPKYVSEGYPLITSKNIINGIVDFQNVNYISKEDLDSINKRSKVDNGDIIMPMIGTIGNPVIVNSDKEFAIKNVALIKFNENSLITNIFVRTLLESHYFEYVISQNKRGGTQKFISLGDIRKLKVIVPPVKLQNQFANFIKQVDKLKFEMEKSLKELEDNLNSLMQKAFNGELLK